MNNKKLFLDELELQLQPVEQPSDLELLIPVDKAQRELEMCLRSISSRVDYVFEASDKYYWN
jgi:hypothetical protein